MRRRLIAAGAIAAAVSSGAFAHAAPAADAADAVLEIVDPGGVSARARLIGAASVAAIPDERDGRRYPRAFGDADLVRRPVGDGVEDLVHYPSRPSREAIDYHLELSGVAGLRLVDRVLELLDADGIPRVRMSAPVVVDAHGVRHDADVSVAGCRFSADPRPPWTVPVVAPGARGCDVRVRWSIRDYPAVLDPAWTLTRYNMTATRSNFALVEMDQGIFAIGGISDGGAVTSSVEVYEPIHQRWSTSTRMSAPRRDFGATRVSLDTFLVAGGCCTESGPCDACSNGVDLYDAKAGKVRALGDVLPHEFATATLVRDRDGGSLVDKVVIVGGSSTAADVYLPDSDAWIRESLPFGPLFDFTATPFPVADSTGRIGLLVCGGRDASGTARDACYLREDGAWSATSHLKAPRYGHTATATSAGILLAGGDDGDGSTEIWSPETGRSTSLLPLLVARRFHAAATRPSGVVILSGGIVRGPATITGTSEGINPLHLDNGWFSRDSMVFPRQGHVMIRVDGDPLAPLLAAGGREEAPLDTSELISPLADNDVCNHDSECESNRCKDGKCCGCGTCHRCTEEGCAVDRFGFDDACPESDDPRACSKRGRCGAHGNCATEDCGFRACKDGECRPAACGDDGDCAPGAACVEIDRQFRCRCRSNEACTAPKICGVTGECAAPIPTQPSPRVSCALSEPAAGAGFTVLALAAALAARRRLQKGKVAKISGIQSHEGPNDRSAESTRDSGAQPTPRGIDREQLAPVTSTYRERNAGPDEGIAAPASARPRSNERKR